MYQAIKENGYIVGIVSGVSDGNITEAEYNGIMSIIESRPTAPDGYVYMLKEDKTWELVLQPEVPQEDEEASVEDYEAAVDRLEGNA